MPSPLITMKVKTFFDKPKVKRAVDRAKRRAMFRSAGFIRTTAKRSMRKRKGPSPPGQPPHSHSGELRKLMRFAVDKSGDTAVIGPLPFKSGTVPNLLEFGGKTKVRRVRKRKGGKRVIESKRVTIAPRPYMGPALKKEIPNMPKAWANSVREG